MENKEQKYYCPMKVLGFGTICNDGYPAIEFNVAVGEFPRNEFKVKSHRCRGWQDACIRCHTECMSYRDDDPTGNGCISRHGYCKMVELIEEPQHE